MRPMNAIFAIAIAICAGSPAFSQCLAPACIVTSHSTTATLDVDNGQPDGGRIHFFSSASGSRVWAVRNFGGLGFFPGEGENTVLMLANSGNVGIGTPTPRSALHVFASGSGTTATFENDFPDRYNFIDLVGGSSGLRFVNGTAENASIRASYSGLILVTDDRERVLLNKSGNLGIGTNDPQSRLHVVGPGAGAVVAAFSQAQGLAVPAGITYVDLLSANSGGNYGSFLRFMNNTTESASLRSVADGQLRIAANGTERIFLTSNGYVGIGIDNPQAALDVAGRTRTESVEITGGSDLAEPFAIEGGAEIGPGTVVRIDPSRPGGLRLADRAYDRTVAGIVSGAGGVDPGLVLSDERLQSRSTFPVALSGRVYCRADATASPIRPGDLLTTSDVPGHAMKATDPSRTPGAVLGKALTPLAEGRGLVLVLVSLQ